MKYVIKDILSILGLQIAIIYIHLFIKNSWENIVRDLIVGLLISIGCVILKNLFLKENRHDDSQDSKNR